HAKMAVTVRRRTVAIKMSVGMNHAMALRIVQAFYYASSAPIRRIIGASLPKLSSMRKIAYQTLRVGATCNGKGSAAASCKEARDQIAEAWQHMLAVEAIADDDAEDINARSSAEAAPACYIIPYLYPIHTLSIPYPYPVALRPCPAPAQRDILN
ncbi:MAG: hypothetical protein ABI068_04335, partial [Ktedonobacterales bacterium]